MAVHIRLARAGTSKVPYYRVVAADHRCARGGRFIERLGSWDPRRSALSLNRTRVRFWMDRGAKASATVAKLLRQAERIAAQAEPEKRAE
ncbi:MAG: 30S ribosomal protein S16 [Deltaproteobacteria bacterium]|nr:30S ribosomal protein S16 [Deltaproteobacteria bacterium]